MGTSRHSHPYRRKPVTGSVRRHDSVAARRRSRLSLGAGIFLFGLLCMIVAGLLGGPASPENGQGAVIMLIVAVLGGVGGLALILWGLMGMPQSESPEVRRSGSRAGEGLP